MARPVDNIDKGTAVRGPVLTTSRDDFAKREAKRKDIFYQQPGDRGPITKLLMQLGHEAPENRWYFYWPEQRFNPMLGDVKGVYTDAALSSAYSGGAAKEDDTIYLALTRQDAEGIIENEQLLIIEPGDDKKQVMLDVGHVNVATDDSSYAVCRLMEDDDSVLDQNNITWRQASIAMAEMSGLPDPTHEDPVWSKNYMQILMASIEASNSELAEEGAEEVNDSLLTRKEAQALNKMQTYMERAILWGRMTLKNQNGRRRSTMGGIYKALSDHDSDLIFNYKTSTDYNNTTWVNGGWDWFQDVITRTSLFSQAEKFVWTGDLALRSINTLLEELGDIHMEPNYNEQWGINVSTLRGVSTTLHFYQHPLFSHDTALRRQALVFEPSLFRLVPLVGRGGVRDLRPVTRDEAQDMGYRSENGHTWVDGFKSGWLTEFSMRWNNLDACAWMKGIGEDNPNT